MNKLYPDWLTKHLSKGVYVNKTVTGYTLYRAHFVYDPIKKRSKKIVDEVLGTVTEEGGFKPKKSYAVNIPQVFQFGDIKAIIDICDYAFQKTEPNMVFYKSEIFVGAILQFLYNTIRENDYIYSVLFLLYPMVRINLMTGKEVYQEILRGAKKIKSILNGFDVSLFSKVFLINDGKRYYVVNKAESLLLVAKEKGVILTYDK